MAARSHRYWGRHNVPTGGLTLLYTVPAEKRAVIKDLYVHNSSLLAREFGFYVPEGAGYYGIHETALASGVGGRACPIYAVLNPGDTVYGWSSGAAGQSFRSYASGVLLDV